MLALANVPEPSFQFGYTVTQELPNTSHNGRVKVGTAVEPVPDKLVQDNTEAGAVHRCVPARARGAVVATLRKSSTPARSTRSTQGLAFACPTRGRRSSSFSNRKSPSFAAACQFAASVLAARPAVRLSGDRSRACYRSDCYWPRGIGAPGCQSKHRQRPKESCKWNRHLSSIEPRPA